MVGFLCHPIHFISCISKQYSEKGPQSSPDSQWHSWLRNGNRTWGILSPWPRNVSDSTICIPRVRSGKSGIRPGLQGRLIPSALLPSSMHLGLAKLSWWPMAWAPTGLLPSHATLHDSICHRQRAQPAPCLRQPLLELRYQQGRIFSGRLMLFFLPLSVRPPSAVQQASCSPAVPWL